MSVTSRGGRARRTRAGALTKQSISSDAAHHRADVEPLEQRLLLIATGMYPTLGALEDPNHTVVRLETTHGIIDIELFDDDAPLSVANFLDYVVNGDWDEIFFYRDDATGFDGVGDTLMLGRHEFDDADGLSLNREEAPILRENTGRLNLQGTLAMRHFGNGMPGTADSATNEFFFNLDDNPLYDGALAAGFFTVFGNVLQGLSVLQSIDGLTVANLTSDPSISGAGASELVRVPVEATYNAMVGLTEADLATIIDIEIIKPADYDVFLSQRVVYPEGYRGNTIVNAIEIANANQLFDAAYQLIVHYENGQRDTVIAGGVLNANQTLVIPISDASDSMLDIVREGQPFAFELQTATSGSYPITATLVHFDFGGAIGEAFVDSTVYSSPDLRLWEFGRVEAGGDARDFIVWQNLSGAQTTITLEFSDGTILTKQLEAYRRGGISLNARLTDGDISAGTYGLRVTSSGADVIVAASRYSAAGGVQPATGVLGVPGGGLRYGVVPGAFMNDSTTLDLWNTSGSLTLTPLFYDLDYIRSNGSVVSGSAVTGGLGNVAPGLLGQIGLRASILPESLLPSAEYFSLVHDGLTGRTHPVYYQSEIGADAVAVSSGVFAASRIGFAGHYDPAGAGVISDDTYTIYNPDQSADHDVVAEFRFSDGTLLSTSLVPVQAGRSVQVRLSQVSGDFNLATIQAKIASDAAFEHYSVTFRAATGVLMAQQTRFDAITGATFSTLGTLMDTVTPLDDASLFGP